MDVVRIVGERIYSRRLLAFDEHLVCVDRMYVRLCGIVVSADANVDMSWHMNHVSLTWHQAGKTLRTGHRELGAHRLNSVDIVVTCCRMIWIAGDHSLQLPHDLLRAGIGL